MVQCFNGNVCWQWLWRLCCRRSHVMAQEMFWRQLHLRASQYHPICDMVVILEICKSIVLHVIQIIIYIEHTWFLFFLNCFHLHGLIDKIQKCDIHELQKAVNFLLYMLNVMWRSYCHITIKKPITGSIKWFVCKTHLINGMVWKWFRSLVYKHRFHWFLYTKDGDTIQNWHITVSPPNHRPCELRLSQGEVQQVVSSIWICICKHDTYVMKGT